MLYTPIQVPTHTASKKSTLMASKSTRPASKSTRTASVTSFWPPLEVQYNSLHMHSHLLILIISVPGSLVDICFHVHL
jgi:hypothetical protein